MRFVRGFNKVFIYLSIYVKSNLMYNDEDYDDVAAMLTSSSVLLSRFDRLSSQHMPCVVSPMWVQSECRSELSRPWCPKRKQCFQNSPLER